MVDNDYYPHPVSELLTHGPLSNDSTSEWFDYVKAYGLRKTHLPMLINLAEGIEVDDSDPRQRDAPVHACRALGQLGDQGADIYLVRLLDDHENLAIVETVMVVLSMLGPSSLKVLKNYFDWPNVCPQSQGLVADCILYFAKNHPHYRDECVQWLKQTLANYAQHTPELNACLVRSLTSLNATEAASEIEQAFQAKQVDEDFCDTWAGVRAALGLTEGTDLTPDKTTTHGTAGTSTLAGQLENASTKAPEPAIKRVFTDQLAASYSISEQLR